MPVEAMDSVPTGLRTYIGANAPVAAQSMEAMLAPYNEIWQRVESLVQFPSGRWDLHLKNNMIVKLPAQDVETAVQRLAKLDRDTFILSRDVGAIDLRLPDRIGLSAKPAQSS